MNRDLKKIVSSGYDEIAETYLHWTAGSSLRQYWLNEISSMLPPDARILDLGCGAGVPVATHFESLGFDVAGVDGSLRQIALARQNAPRSKFVHEDMTSIDFNPSSFDAVTAFYSITHVPRDEHQELLDRMLGWLKPGGLMLASMGYDDLPDRTEKWLDTEMFFSHFDATTNAALIESAGFDIVRSEVIGEVENGETVRFLWVIARRPNLWP